SLADLADALDFDPAERGGVLALVARTGGSVTALTDDDLALPDANISNAGAHAAAPSGPALARTLKPLPDVARVRFADAEASYQVGQAFARAGIPTGGGELSLDLAVVATHADALQIGARALARAEAGRDTATAYVSALAALSFEPGDLISLPGSSVVWKVSRVDLDGQP
ncbi:phage tail protein, partial [Cutibacterium acnes]